MSIEHRARVESVSWHPAQGATAVTIAIPGRHDLERGENVTITTKESAK